MKPKAKLTEASEKKLIKSHKKIATHLEEAAKKHREFVKHYEEGDYDKAYNSTIEAHSHAKLATEAQTEMLKHPIFTS
jgi:hypothetical protein